MRLVISLFSLLLAASLTAFGQSASTNHEHPDPEATGPSTQIFGCLQGSPGAYRLISQSGNPHLLIGDEESLRSHLGDRVTLQGYRDDNRDASASSDQGTPHGMRFFQVEDVTADSGKCSVR
jgi:hypothetical protein